MKAGRKTKYTPATKRAIIKAISIGTPITHACKSAGVSFETLTVWRERYPDFANELDVAFSKAVKANLLIVQKTAKSRDQRLAFAAATWWLSHASGAREFFSDSQRNTTHISVNSDRVVLYLPQKSDPPQLPKSDVAQIQFDQG